MIDWKARYLELIEMVNAIANKKSEIDFLLQQIAFHADKYKMLEQSKTGKIVLMRLKADVGLPIEYESGPSDVRVYRAGTLIDCGADGRIFLNLDGEGHLHFPPELIEPVEFDRFDPTVDWKNVIRRCW